MARDFLDELAQAPVPPMPPAFDRALHERLNRRLTAGHFLDLGFRGVPQALAHFAQALAGLAAFTLIGRFERKE
jgi:hypothetical protein